VALSHKLGFLLRPTSVLVRSPSRRYAVGIADEERSVVKLYFETRDAADESASTARHEGLGAEVEDRGDRGCRVMVSGPAEATQSFAKRNLGNTFTGWVYIDVGWHLRTGEKWGFPRDEGPEVRATFDSRVGYLDTEHRTFDTVDEALQWGRALAPLILVRVGPTDKEMYSAGTARAYNDDLPFPHWDDVGGPASE
jgi:hypothetical protein